jgi:hypothetical protein
MGWKQSPPLFTAATQTVADLANSKRHSKQSSAPRHPDLVSETLIRPDDARPDSTVGPEHAPLLVHDSRCLHRKPVPVKTWDVYVDEFIGLVQGNHKHRQHDNHILLSSLDEVLRRLEDQDKVHRQEPASVKKMLKGDAIWATKKMSLGGFWTLVQ